MSVLRQDPTTREWVIVAPDRARRPNDRGAARAREAAPGARGVPLLPRP